MSNAGGQNSRQYEETRRRLFGKHPELEAQLKIIETQDSSFFETILKIEHILNHEGATRVLLHSLSAN